MSRTKAVIFDCDGVLADTEELGNDLLVKLARPHCDQIDLNDLLHPFKGLPLSKCIELIESRVGRRLPNDFIHFYRQELLKKLEQSLRPIDGVRDALESLSLPRCVASGSPLNKIEFILRQLDFIKFFEGRIYSSYELDLWKPSPALFLHAASQMGFAPDSIAVIEDSPVGVQAGVSAGMNVFHYVPGAAVAYAGGVTTFGRMSELLALLS